MKDCKARQYSDQMQCARCGLAWDVNDPDPPRCAPTKPPRQEIRCSNSPVTFRQHMSRVKRELER